LSSVDKFNQSPPVKPGVLDWLSASAPPDIRAIAQNLTIPNYFNPGGSLKLIAAGPRRSIDYLRTLRQGLSDSAIGAFLGVSRNRVADLIRGIQYGGEPSWAAEWVNEVWAAARYASSPWLEESGVPALLSHHIVERYQIPVSSSLIPLHKLDTEAAEFTHRHSGEKIIVYSLQRWKGTPTRVGDPLSWDHKGHYVIEFVSGSGERGTVAPSALGLSEDAVHFGKGFNTASRRRRDSDAFETIVESVRRTYRILPPY